jgi:hypothetical protein
MKHFPFILIMLVLGCGLPSAARAEIFSDAANNFSFEVPEGWSAIDAGAIDKVTRWASSDPALRCFAGFEFGEQGTLLISASPYPEEASYSGVTLQQIKQIAATLTGVNPGEFHEAQRPVVPAMGAGTVRQITCFTNPPGFVIDYQDVQQEARSHSIAYVGKDRLVMLHFFMRPSDYRIVKRSMDEIATNFRYGRRQAVSFQSPTAATDQPIAWAVYGFVSLLVLVSGVIVYYLFKRQTF